MVTKKGIMLRFLTGLLLALLVFGFASCVGAKWFRLTSQASTNFADLAAEIQEVAKSPLPQVRPFVFIQDAETYVYFINDRTRRNTMWLNDVTYSLPSPAECEKQTCLCLCTEFGDNEDSELRECQKLICKSLPRVEFSPDSEIIAYRSEDGPRRQTVRIIKCVANTPYCRGKDGDISVIFNWWDDQKAYEAIK